MQDADCVGILSCGCQNADVGCLSGCESHYSSGGKSHYDAYATCLRTSCMAQCPPGADWRCLASGTGFPPIGSINGVPLDVSFGFPRLLSPGSSATATIAACGPTDINCATPSTSGTTDATGHVTLTLPTAGAGFVGYFQLSDPSLTPTLLYISNPPIVDDGATEAPFVFTTQDFTALASQTSVTIDAARGAVFVMASDCAGATAQGVSFTVSNADTSSKTFYVLKGTATTSATSTDPLGVGGVLNVPVSGGVTVRATVMATGATVGSAQVMVRAGTVTVVKLGP
jgi:hypothetical protein